MDTIRVLHVIGSLNNGGSQAMVMSLYRNIDRSKIQFDFIIDRDEERYFENEIKALGGNIYYFPQFTISNVKNFIRTWNEFFDSHKEYQIIHGHVRSTASIYLKIAKKKGLFTIAHSHSISSGTGVHALVKNILQYGIRFTADYFFACSNEAGRWLFGKKICESSEFKVLRNAIDLEKFSFSKEMRDGKRAELGLEQKFVIGHVGRFYSPKNHRFLIEIFKEVYKKNSEARLLLVGSGEEEQVIRNKVKEWNLQQAVIFAGVRNDVNELMQVMDVFVFPSLFEGLGIVLIEAQATGLPCFASKDRIPKEAEVTELLKFISLSQSASVWADLILESLKVIDRKDERYNLRIKKKGYDIKDTTSWIERFYISMYK